MAKSQSVKRPALFLDRDGVINIDHGYVYKPEDFEFVDGIFELVKRANDAGYLVIIITNQAGIGRGYYTEDDFHALMEWVKNEFSAHDARIDGIYFCPHHSEFGMGKYKLECGCRKPNPGMILKAATDYSIDLPHSILIGDKQTDIDAGVTAGIQRIFHFEGNSIRQISKNLFAS